jgi:radical SAM protein with 4Fe4S-binding SPASM domain
LLLAITFGDDNNDSDGSSFPVIILLLSRNLLFPLKDNIKVSGQMETIGDKQELCGTELEQYVKEIVASTKRYIWIREEDQCLILRPNRVHHLNETATTILSRLYRGDDVNEVVTDISERFDVSSKTVEEDVIKLLSAICSILRRDYCPDCTPQIRTTPFGSHELKYPVLSEIAVTYRCQNRCMFCYADAGSRNAEELDTESLCRIIWKIFHEACCPSLSFTGGEPTLRNDLPELIEYAKSLKERDQGMRVNLITNGIRCSSKNYVLKLKRAGLDSAQVSLEAGMAEIHDAITKTPGSFDKTVQGINNLKSAGIHTHTNTTICSINKNHVLQLVDFLADELRNEYFSANMVIQTGKALKTDVQVTYKEVANLLPDIVEYSRGKGIRFVWYSPMPYCLFNPVAYGLGSKSCAACHGLLSVDPTGNVLPCSSFGKGVGNLLTESFDEVWNNRVSRYWREKRFVPPVCEDCEIVDVCGGACPLYWDAVKNFDEIPTPSCGKLELTKWKIQRSLKGRVWGVGKG